MNDVDVTTLAVCCVVRGAATDAGVVNDVDVRILDICCVVCGAADAGVVNNVL